MLSTGEMFAGAVSVLLGVTLTTAMHACTAEPEPFYWQPEVPCRWSGCPGDTVCYKDGACWVPCETDEDCGPDGRCLERVGETEGKRWCFEDARAFATDEEE